MRIFAVLFVLSLGCIHRLERTVTPQVATVDHKAAFLKVHMKNGDLYVLSAWRADEQRREVTGTGAQFGADRFIVRTGEHRIAMADVALYETNQVVASPSIAAMAVITGASVALSIDHVARATLEHKVTPQRIAPQAIRGTLGREYAAGRVAATGFPIVTQPGDAYELDYAIPPGEVELFLDTRGYYLEWMRAEWLREQQPLAAMKMLLDPAQAMRDLAPAWKRMEPQAEQLFWRSRYAHP